MKAINLVLAVAVAGGCAVDDVESDALETSTEQAATTDVWHATWNGGSVSASFWTPTGSGYLDVFEGKSGSTRYAYLNFSTWSFDPTSQECFTYTDWWSGMEYQACWYTRYTYAYGWGQIPASDAQLTPAHARVNTTLGSNFSGYQCTVDYSTWTFNCGAPTGGTIDVQWNKNGQYSSFSSGVNQQTYGAYTYKSQGTARFSSATASGAALGVSFEGASGSFGDTRGTNVTKSVIATPPMM